MTTLSDLNVVAAVRKNLDEIQTNDSAFVGGSDEDDLDGIIKSKKEEAYRFIVAKADVEKLGSTAITEATATSEASPAVANISSNFRFVYAISSNWSYPVYETILWNTPEYAMLKNSLTTGTKDRPKVGVVPNTGSDKGKYSVELYGCTSGTVGYINLDATVTDTTTLPDELYTAFIYYVTALTLLTLRDENHAKSMLSQAVALLGIDPSVNNNEQ